MIFSKITPRNDELEALADRLLSSHPDAKRLVFFHNTTDLSGTSTVLIRNRPTLRHPDGRPVSVNPNKPSFWLAQLSYNLTQSPSVSTEFGKDISDQPETALCLLTEAARTLRIRHQVWQQADLLFLPVLITCQGRLL